MFIVTEPLNWEVKEGCERGWAQFFSHHRKKKNTHPLSLQSWMMLHLCDYELRRKMNLSCSGLENKLKIILQKCQQAYGLVYDHSVVLSFRPAWWSLTGWFWVSKFLRRRKRSLWSNARVKKRAENECAASAFRLVRNTQMYTLTHADIHKTQWNRSCLREWLIHIHTHTHTYTHTGILACSEKLMFKGVIKEHCASFVLWPNRGSEGHEIRLKLLTCGCAHECVYSCICVLCVMFKNTTLLGFIPWNPPIAH